MLGVYSPEEFDDAVAAVTNGISVHHPDDYADGTPEKLTKAPEPQTYSRRLVAEIFKCQSADELHEWGAAHSQQVNGFPADIKNKVYAAFNDRLGQLEAVADQVIIDDDGERPARPEDFAEDTVEQIAGSISERAIAARDARPPRLQELNGPYDFPEMPPELDRRRS